MKFEFKGQTYEVDENNVIFSINKDGCINCLEFREPVKVKPRWQVTLSTRRGSSDADKECLIESDNYVGCRSRFNSEKEYMIKQLLMTETGYRLEVTDVYNDFIVKDVGNDVEYYLRLAKC